MIVDPEIPEQETVVKLLDVLFPSIKIYLFGSRARKTHRPTSDIDLALDIGRTILPHEMGCMRNIIDAVNIPHKVDLVDMHSIPQDLKNIILKEGIAWKNA